MRKLAVAEFGKEASQARDYRVAKCVTHRAARPDPWLRKERLLGMTMKTPASASECVRFRTLAPTNGQNSSLNLAWFGRKLLETRDLLGWDSGLVRAILYAKWTLLAHPPQVNVVAARSFMQPSESCSLLW
jgi:hypothetical protein